MPRRAFVAAWTVTGYFGPSHFGDLGMSQDDARETLDSTGLLKCVGIRDDRAADVPQTNRSWSCKVVTGWFGDIGCLTSVT